MIITDWPVDWPRVPEAGVLVIRVNTGVVPRLSPDRWMDLAQINTSLIPPGPENRCLLVFLLPRLHLA